MSLAAGAGRLAEAVLWQQSAPLPGLALPRPHPRVCLPSASHPTLGTCRCFGCQSQGAEEGRASTYVLEGGP